MRYSRDVNALLAWAILGSNKMDNRMSKGKIPEGVLRSEKGVSNSHLPEH